MKKQYKQEIRYLYSLINSVEYPSNAFTIIQSDGKYIFGITSAPGQESPLSKILEYKTISDTLCDLDEKVKLSLKMAIKSSYSHYVFKNFKMLKKPKGKELLAYYYIENAAFRTSSMWDALAQLYRIKYDIDIDFNRVNYKKIFDPSKAFCTKFKSNAQIIHDYINEKDNTDCEGTWKGNHAFIVEYRNKMTHRNSPNVAVASNLDFNLKHHPSFVLKRLVEDYAQVFYFINNILNEAMEESCQIFDETFKITI